MPWVLPVKLLLNKFNVLPDYPDVAWGEFELVYVLEDKGKVVNNVVWVDCELHSNLICRMMEFSTAK